MDYYNEPIIFTSLLPGTMSTSLDNSNSNANNTSILGAPEDDIDTSPPPTESRSLEWPDMVLIAALCILIIVTIVGNTLVILAVVTTRRLRTVTNCFVMSLAVADWLVGIFVMPPAVAVHVMGSWQLGRALCDVWVSLDILLCTASILSLCAISVDRYLAVTQPLNYSRRRRSKRLALAMIVVVWLAAAAITCPPIFGWYEPGRHEGNTCRYNKNEGYVVFSAMGSFFLPMTVMLYVYVRISCVIAQRHDQLAGIDAHRCKRSISLRKQKLVCREESDCRGSSECEDATVVNRCSGNSSTQNINRSVRSTHTYSFHTSDHTPTPQRAASIYNKNTTTLAVSRSRPESLHLDVSVLNLEPTNRVSSFRRETKTAQTLSIVVGGFVACWLPFFIYYLLTPFLPNVSPLIMAFLTWLGWINSAINPFIYAFYAPDFRIAFWRLTFRHCSDNQRVNFAFHNK